MNNEEKLLIDNLIGRRDYLRSEHLYKRGYNYVKEVLDMPEWNNPKFQYLLTSNIWQTNIEVIREVLNMPEWNDPKFHGLLTSNIWKSKIEEIRAILKMEKLQQKEYVHLLCPGIFNVCYENIIPSIELHEQYGIGKYITNRCLRRNIELQSCLIDYLVKNNIDLLVEKQDGGYKLNSMLSCSNTELLKKYKIDIKEIYNEENKKRCQM